MKMVKKDRNSGAQQPQSLNPYAPGNPLVAVSQTGPSQPVKPVANAEEDWEREISRGPRGHGHSQAYGGALGYQDESLRTPLNSGQTHYDRADRPKPKKIE